VSNFAPKRTSYDTGDSRWLRDALRAETHGVTLDGSLFTSDAAGILVKSGSHIGKVTATGLGGPYNGTTDEVQTVTVTGSPTGGSFTLTFTGQTTGAIAHNASASTVQAALVALSNIGTGNVEVAGSNGGPYTVRFVGDLANTDVAEMTATASLTGGSTPGVTVATTTAGGAATDIPAGLGTSDGHLRNALLIRPGERHLVAVVHAGTVDRRFLPAGNHDISAEADLTAVAYIN